MDKYLYIIIFLFHIALIRDIYSSTLFLLKMSLTNFSKKKNYYKLFCQKKLIIY